MFLINTYMYLKGFSVLDEGWRGLWLHISQSLNCPTWQSGSFLMLHSSVTIVLLSVSHFCIMMFGCNVGGFVFRFVVFCFFLDHIKTDGRYLRYSDFPHSKWSSCVMMTSVHAYMRGNACTRVFYYSSCSSSFMFERTTEGNVKPSCRHLHCGGLFSSYHKLAPQHTHNSPPIHTLPLCLIQRTHCCAHVVYVEMIK